MELMEIIKSSITLFSAFLLAILFVSYIIFKVRDKSRVKPYENIKPVEIIKHPVIKRQDIQHKPAAAPQRIIAPQYQAAIKPVMAPVHYANEVTNHPIHPVKPRISIYNQYSFNSDEQMHKLRLSNYYSPNL